MDQSQPLDENLPESESQADAELEDLEENPMTLDLVSGLAGRPSIDRPGKRALERVEKGPAATVYSDLLHAVTHQFFPASVAQNLWNQILRHKYDMAYTLKRNIRIAVASLDFLSNLTGELRSPTVIDERRIAGIIDHSLRDGLTRLFNHTACFHKIKIELSRFERTTVVSLMMIDIDDFKKINDTYGHVEGDGVLSILGKVIVQEIRDTDTAAGTGARNSR